MSMHLFCSTSDSANVALNFSVPTLGEDESASGSVIPLILPEMKDQAYFAIHQILECFVKSSSKTLVLPKCLTALQKNYLLTIVQCMGLKVKCSRNEDAYVMKTRSATRFVRNFVIGEDSMQRMTELLHWLENNSTHDKLRVEQLKPFASRTVAVLTCGNPRVPKPAKSNVFESHRKALPIFKHRTEILEMIKNNTFLVIKGTAGCGKTTQVPQYVLEDAEESKTPVRILVCLPRRVGAIAVCDRVAAERGEKVGHTVGYQIRLESCTSPVETLLNFCTGTVLLRAMTTPGCPLLDSTTHIILDEVHCRDRYQDFLMNCLRDFALTKSHLKFIFLGEDPQIDFVNEYFGGLPKCPRLIVEGTLHQVQTVYLEEILRYTWKSSANGSSTPIVHCMHTFGGKTDEHQKNRNAKEYDVDSLIEGAWKKVDVDVCLYDFLHMVRDDEISVDYQHSVTSISMLMAVSAAGMVEYVEQLLDVGADMNLKSQKNYTARDWAVKMNRKEVVTLLDLKTVLSEADRCPNPTSCIVQDYYQKTVSNKVDFCLILRLVHMIHLTDLTGGSILIFLPSYEDLNNLKERICYSCKNDPGWTSNPFVIHFLHAHIQTGDQRSVFEKPKSGLRKIILSTDIGQSCLTFEDVVFVIDCGKSNEDVHHAMAFAGTETNMKKVKYGWISKAEANQRRARAGRCTPGICYRLYSMKCYEENMSEFVVPEMLRTPLLNLCLQSRALLRNEVTIAEFFSCLPTPPPEVDVLHAVKTLKLIGVLHDNEQMTILGVHLLDYSIDPRWAKALLYSVIFKCMDPILTMASYVSYGDAFVHQYHPQRRQMAYRRKLSLSDGTLSDHMAILKVFHKWESERALREGNVVEFCGNNFVTSSTFDVVYGIRTRLLGQLRASGFVRNKGIHDVKDLNTNADNWSVVKAVLTAALYPNICAVNRFQKNLFDRGSKELSLHPSSVLAIEKFDWFQELPSDWIIFNEKCCGPKGTGFVKGCTVVNSTTVALLAGDLWAKPKSLILPLAPLVHGTGFTFSLSDRNVSSSEGTKVRLSIDNWISMFSFSHKISDIIPLREHIQHMILRRLRRPELFPSQVDKCILDCLVQVISAEDARIGLKQSSVGQWPKLVAGNLLSAPRTGFEVTQ